MDGRDDVLSEGVVQIPLTCKITLTLRNLCIGLQYFCEKWLYFLIFFFMFFISWICRWKHSSRINHTHLGGSVDTATIAGSRDQITSGSWLRHIKCFGLFELFFVKRRRSVLSKEILVAFVLTQSCWFFFSHTDRSPFIIEKFRRKLQLLKYKFLDRQVLRYLRGLIFFFVLNYIFNFFHAIDPIFQKFALVNNYISLFNLFIKFILIIKMILVQSFWN